LVEQRHDVVIANAGLLTQKNFIDMEDSEIINLLRVNVYHPLILAKAFADKQGSQRGLFIMLSSMSAYLPFPGASVYGATKRFDMFLG